MEEHPLVCYGDHQSLANALSNRDIDSFRRALHSPTEVEKHDIESTMTIFEKACHTQNCAQFIEECILAGCDVNKLNAELNKHPINFVVDSHCVDNLAALLRDPSVDVNSKGPSQKTPVNSLSEQITDDNLQNIFPCIRLLISHGADVNIPDWRETPPIVHILKNRNLSAGNKKLIVKYLLQNVVEVDIDSHRNGEARKLLEKSMPDIELMPKTNETVPNSASSHRQWDFNRLFLELKNEKEDEFLEGIQQVAEKNPAILQELFTATEGRQTLLIVAVEKDLVLAVEKMIQLGADVNFYADATKDTMSPVKCACVRGHWRSLEVLLGSPELDLNSAPLLPVVVRKLGEKPTKICDYEKCFDMLLNHRNIDVNQMDMTHSTALHYAVKFNNSRAILELLKHGAYIGVRNVHNRLSIWNINPQVLEKHFDSCITTNEYRRSDDSFEIDFDYKNIIPQNHFHTESITDEMKSIEYISTSKELKFLMLHPLIASFLSLKWNRLVLFFYINFIFCTLFAVTTVTYILIYYNHQGNSTIKDCMRLMIFILTIYIAAREMFQFTFSPCTYLKGLENYLECTLVVLVMLILFDVCPPSWRQTFGATSILFIAIEIFLLAGSLPFWSFSTHYVMLRTVTFSFLKSLSLYAIILLAFSLSFFTLLHEQVDESDADTKAADDDDGDFNKFSNLGLSIMKTLVMSTGEFDVASINFKTNTFSYLVFMLFLFLVTIILLNLLNGLAVSDTQAIKSEAELTNFIRRAQVLARYECVLATSYSTIFKIFPFCNEFDAFDESKPNYNIRIKPNASNQILIPDLTNSNDDVDPTDDNLQPLLCVHRFFCCNRCTHMDSKIVKLAFQCLDKKAIEKQEEDEREKYNERLVRMEATLDAIADKLNDILKK